MFCHRPIPMGSLLFVVLNLQSKIASFISKIFKVLGEFCTKEFQF